MNNEIKDILNKLKSSTSELETIRQIYEREKEIDYFDTEDRGKMEMERFNENFKTKEQKIDVQINSFIGFIEKSFAPTPEENAKEKALQKLRSKYSNFDTWNDDVKKDLLETELKEIGKTPKESSQKKKSQTNRYIDNPEPDKAFSLNSNFEFCKPYAIVIGTVRYEIFSLKDALRSIAQYLCSKNVKPLKDFVTTDSKTSPLFSRTKDKYRTPLEIADGIYTESNLNASGITNTCRRLLDIYDIEYDEVKIYLQKIAKH
jgi:hypothetical protein